MGLFAYKLERADGTPADPPVLHTAIPTWQAGDTIPLARDQTLRVIEIRPGSHAHDNLTKALILATPSC